MELERLIVSPTNPELRHSSSCRDISSAFYYLKEVWTQLGWQEVAFNQTLTSKIVNVRAYLTLKLHRIPPLAINYRKRLVRQKFDTNRSCSAMKTTIVYKIDLFYNKKWFKKPRFNSANGKVSDLGHKGPRFEPRRFLH